VWESLICIYDKELADRRNSLNRKTAKTDFANESTFLCFVKIFGRQLSFNAAFEECFVVKSELRVRLAQGVW